MATEKANGPADNSGAEFSGAMDELVRKYDEVINEFKDVLDEQTRKILNDPKLGRKEQEESAE